MAAPTATRTKRQPLPSNLAAIAEQGKRAKAAITIQRVFRGFSERKRHAARFEELQASGTKAYETLRVYHGTHADNAQGILEKGLIPQGGSGLTGMIGHKTVSEGKVFFTRHKEQAAFYALTVSGMEQHDRLRAARQQKDEEAEHLARTEPPAPTVLRMLLPRATQQQAVHDDKGGEQDFTLKQKVPSSQLLPGHLEPVADPMPRRVMAVMLFQAEMNKGGVNATLGEATGMLMQLRRKSVSGDVAALQSAHATGSAKPFLESYRLQKPL